MGRYKKHIRIYDTTHQKMPIFCTKRKDCYRRYYQIGGITIRVEADIPITDVTFHPKFKGFEMDEPGEDIITIRHHFSLPFLAGLDLGDEIYRKVPWIIYRKNDSLSYVGISENRFGAVSRFRIGLVSRGFSPSGIYTQNKSGFELGNIFFLSVFNNHNT